MKYAGRIFHSLIQRATRAFRWLDSRAILNRWPIHPLWPTVLTLLVIITGGYGSVFSDQIRSAFPLSFGPYGGWSWHATTFYFLALIAAWLFFWRQRADDHQRKILTEQTEKLETLIKTLPPANFLEHFAKYYITADKAMEVAFGPPPDQLDQQNLERSARHILRLVAVLAQAFDGNHMNVTYAANVMLFRPSEGLSQLQQTAIEPRLRFRETGVHCLGLKGILDLVTRFSTTSTNEQELPDPTLHPLALPVPHHVTSPQGRYNVLPGAPLAFATSQFSYFADTWQIPDWCERQGDFTAAVREQLRQYFERAQHFRSFVSIPLVGTGQILGFADAEAQTPLGVLNIHSSRSNLLKGGASGALGGFNPLEQFAFVTQPLIVMLAKLLARSAGHFTE
jgi:hypothetical protein